MAVATAVVQKKVLPVRSLKSSLPKGQLSPITYRQSPAKLAVEVQTAPPKEARKRKRKDYWRCEWSTRSTGKFVGIFIAPTSDIMGVVKWDYSM